MALKLEAWAGGWSSATGPGVLGLGLDLPTPRQPDTHTHITVDHKSRHTGTRDTFYTWQHSLNVRSLCSHCALLM